MTRLALPADPATRREALRAAGGACLVAALAALGLLAPGGAAAQAAAFQARTLADVLRALGVAMPADSRDLRLDAPDIAENGAVVPIVVRSSLPGTERIVLLVEKNPFPLVCSHEVLSAMEPEVGLRIRMAESSDVVALVKAGGRWHATRREVRVTLGGCGA